MKPERAEARTTYEEPDRLKQGLQYEEVGGGTGRKLHTECAGHFDGTPAMPCGHFSDGVVKALQPRTVVLWGLMVPTRMVANGEGYLQAWEDGWALIDRQECLSYFRCRRP